MTDLAIRVAYLVQQCRHGETRSKVVGGQNG